MPIDHHRIEALNQYTDPSSGIRERFLTPELGGGGTVAVLSEPLHARPEGGWVICHSFGSDFDSLAAFEATLARRLAGVGFATLRFHAQGYGDSYLGADQIGLQGHVVGAMEADDLLRSATRVTRIGFVGALFGASVAALAADGARAAALAAIEPPVDGRSFVRSRIRRDLSAQLADGSRTAKDDSPDPASGKETIELDGFPVRREALAEIESMDLPRDLCAFNGRSLVLQISRSAEPRPDIQRLVDRLTELGGDCSWGVVADKDALRFGSQPWRQSELGKKTNVLGPLTERILTKTLGWIAPGTVDTRSVVSRDE